MEMNPRTLALIHQRLDEAERNIQYIRHVLREDESPEEHDSSMNASPVPRDMPAGEQIIEGVFDGKNMQGNNGEEYPIPPNYASKSKLVEGDVLKLTIGADGSFTYKQIGPVNRRRAIGALVVDEQGNFGVNTTDKTYRILLASVTFYRAQVGDEVTILLPEHGEAEWGAVDNIIPQHS